MDSVEVDIHESAFLNELDSITFSARNSIRILLFNEAEAFRRKISKFYEMPESEFLWMKYLSLLIYSLDAAYP